ncbi:replication initiator, partial [Antrihabitans cavernicola]
MSTSATTPPGSTPPSSTPHGPTTPTSPGQLDPTSGHGARVVAEMVRRAGRLDYPQWWHSVRATGYCMHPIHLRRGHGLTRADRLLVRCGNRRAAVCLSCSRLYAGDTWQLVHAGILGGHHDVPATVVEHPQVFLTLTAPSFGPVYPPEHPTRAGEPRHPARYDYVGHVLFTWWAPDLWRRYTIRLRRLVSARLKEHGEAADSLRVAFLKVHETQTRLIPHYHAVLRLDASTTAAGQPPSTSLTAGELAALAAQVKYPRFSSDLYRRIEAMPRQYPPEVRQRALRLLEVTLQDSE